MRPSVRSCLPAGGWSKRENLSVGDVEQMAAWRHQLTTVLCEQYAVPEAVVEADRTRYAEATSGRPHDQRVTEDALAIALVAFQTRTTACPRFLCDSSAAKD